MLLDEGHITTGYSTDWWHANNKEELEHYIMIYKLHESSRTSTNDRNKYWREDYENKRSM